MSSGKGNKKGRESHSVMSDSLQLYSPWNSLGQNTEVGRLSLLQGSLPNPEIGPSSPTLQADSLCIKNNNNNRQGKNRMASTRMFSVIQLITANNQKQTQCLSTLEWINN